MGYRLKPHPHSADEQPVTFGVWRARFAARETRRPVADESGFTIIELLVALTVLSIGIVGTASVFLSSLRVTAVAENRTRAVSIASREVEGMRAADYADVGFSALATGFRAGVTEAGNACTPPATGCFETVVSSTPTSTPLAPTETVENIDFAIRRDIVWVGNAISSRAYKRLISRVTWTDNGGAHEIVHDAGFYPGGLGSVATSSTTTSTTAAVAPGAPSNFTATLNSQTPSTAVDLTWQAGTPAASTWGIDASSNGGVTWGTLVTGLPGGNTSYNATALSSGTAYQFRIRGTTGSLSSTYASASATTAAASGCTIGSASVSPATATKKNNNTLFQDLLVTVNTSGTCSGLKVKYPATGDPAAVALAQNGAVFTHTLDKNTYFWTVGSKVIRILSSTGTELAQISLVITT